MAKTQTTEKTTAPVVEEKPNAAVGTATVPKAGALAAVAALPDYLSASTEGTEHIESKDMVLPRLALAQKMSHEVDPEHDAFIQGLQIGQLFDTVEKTIFGEGPIEFVIVRADRPRFVEFFPRDAGGGVKDLNVPVGDPRTQFTRNEKGETVPPVATMFYDFIVLVLPSATVPELKMLGLSFKNTGIKAAKQLNSLIKLRGRALYAGKYELSTASAENKKGKFKVYTVKNSSIPSEYSASDTTGKKMPGWVNLELYNYAKEQFELLKDKKVTIDAETETAEDEGDADFTPEQYEQGQTVEGQVVTDM
jgi:hypothetical protein